MSEPVLDNNHLLVGCALLTDDPAELAKAEAIAPPDFLPAGTLQDTYSACLEAMHTGLPPGAISVQQILAARGKPVTTASLISLIEFDYRVSGARLIGAATEVARSYRLAALRRACFEVSQEQAPTSALESVVTRLESITEIARSSPKNGVHVPFVTRCLLDIQPEQIEWLWSPYIPLGKLTLVAGDPGVGKSWLSLAIAAALSRSLPLGGNGPAAPAGSTLLLAAEDDPADTIRPRLDALGADPASVHILDGVQRGGSVQQATLQDIDTIRAACAHIRPRLIIVDPIQAHLGAEVDAHRANEVRPLLQGLAAVATEFHAACLLVCHMAKGTSQRSIYRVLGSIDFVAAARSMLMVGPDPDDDRTVVVAHGKASCAAKGESISYTLRDGRFEWCGVSKVTAADLNAAGDSSGSSAIDEAELWLTTTLSDGPRPSTEMHHLAESEDISERTLRRARKRLKVVEFKDGKRWLWKLP